MPTRKTIFWILGAGILYLIAWNVGSGWLYILTTMILAMPLVSLAFCRWNLRGIEAGLRAPASVSAGEKYNVSLEIVNRARLPRFLISLDVDLAGERRRVFLPALKAGRRQRVPLTFEHPGRGIYDGADVTLESSAPVGLAYSRRRLKAGDEMAVYPSWFLLGGDWATGLKYAGYMATSALPTRNTASDYLGVRDYRAGDSPRSIHWRSSARAGSLAVIEYARQSVMTPVFLVDTFAEADVGSGPASTFETAITIVATLIQREARNNRRFAVGSSPDDCSRRELDSSASSSLLWLAGVQAGSSQPMDLTAESLPWPEVTPVLILTNHRVYGQIDQSVFVQAFPHSVVIMLDGAGFAADKKQRSQLLAPGAIEALAERLEARGSEFRLVGAPEETALCLAGL